MPSFFWKYSFQVMVTALGLIIGDYIMDGVRFDATWKALLAAIVLGLLNAVLKPILVLLTIPATLFTFGLFLLVINAVILLIAKEIVPGFYLDGFWSAFWLSLFLSLVTTLFGAQVKVQVKRGPNHDQWEQ
jgi:putative membrane protein